jgi:putative methionine-R-sulfoxide reductase with GAF domain
MQGFPQPDDRPSPFDSARGSSNASSGSESSAAADDRINAAQALEEPELEAALQLLVERAQYITGATGTALALPHGDEMVCRASAGSCAPSVGARLQVRSGLTGESIERRQLLRCDNAETDPRVNLETCRALGIASIVVLPLLRKNGEVRGLFELFSDHPYAFEERDLIALERMADLTLTALDLSEQRNGAIPPPRPIKQPSDEPARKAVAPIVTGEPMTAASPQPTPAVPVASALVPRAGAPASPATSFDAAAPAPSSVATPVPSPAVAPVAPTVAATPAQTNATPPVPPHAVIPEAPGPGSTSAPASILASVGAVEAVKPVETQASPVLPEAMRKVQKCASCGFPVSEGRTLCLDCERKQSKSAAQPALAVSSESGVKQAVEPGAIEPDEVLPPFLANATLTKESWLSNHVNLLAIAVVILGVLVAYVVFAK